MVRDKFSLGKWLLLAAGALAMAPGAFAQTVGVPVFQRNLVEPAGDPARELFNRGQSLFDKYRYIEAEKTFRQVVFDYSKSNVADKAEYYLIRTLGQLGKTQEALTRINLFPKTYPNSAWNGDVEELGMQLTGQAPALARSILIRRVPAFTLADAQAFNQQISHMQEMLRVLFRTDVNDALQITNERLKTNMADPVALSVLGVVANTAGPQGLPILVNVARNSPDLKARRDAIYFVSRTQGDKDATVDALTDLLAGANDDTADAVMFSLAEIRTEKAYNALAVIVLDKMRSDKIRELALVRLGQNHDLRAKAALETINISDTDRRFRAEALHIIESLPRG